MVNRSVSDVTIKDVEKRRYPSKHYVYVIYVTWSDNAVSVVYRRYSKFFSFQCKLLDAFQEEGGAEDPSSRSIPFMPGKIFLGRSHIYKVALKRAKALDHYLKALIKLPSHISQSQLVTTFFETTQEDLNPQEKLDDGKQSADNISDPVALDQYMAVADYAKQRPNEVDLTDGMVVDVYEKKETGWWFVSTDNAQGWVPGSYLERLDGMQEDINIAVSGKEETYVCVKDYAAIQSDEIHLEKGMNVLVLEKKLDGWWHVRYKDREGWAPAAYLVKPGSAQSERLKHAESEQPVKLKSGAQTSAVKSSALSKPKTRPLPPRKNSIERPKKPRPPRPAPPAAKSVYYTIADFTDTAGDGISFKEGQTAKLLEKSGTGWWFIDIDGVQGWAPSTYLQERKSSVPARPPAPKPSRPTNTDLVKKSPHAGSEEASKINQQSFGSKAMNKLDSESSGMLSQTLGSKELKRPVAVVKSPDNGQQESADETRPSVSQLRQMLEKSTFS